MPILLLVIVVSESRFCSTVLNFTCIIIIIIISSSSSYTSYTQFAGSYSPEKKAHRTDGDSRQLCQDDAGERARRDDSPRAKERQHAVRRLVECRAPVTEHGYADAEERHPRSSGARFQTLQRKERLIHHFDHYDRQLLFICSFTD